MLKRLIPLVIIGVILSLAAVACGGDGDSDSTATPGQSSPSPVPAAPTATAASGGSNGSSQTTAQPGGMTVEVLNRDNGGSGKYAFEPADFTFKVGDTVTFVMTAETEYHTFTVDDLDIDEAVSSGDTVEFTVTFDKAGEFHLFCIPHEALGMEGTIKVQ